MYLIDNKNITDTAVNLALEEFCFRQLKPEKGCALFYINRPSVILGRHQVAWQEADLDFCTTHGIQIIRRISGGGAVYHDPGNLNFSFITRYQRNRFHNFEFFTAPIVRALRRMGLPSLANKGNAITASGKKLSGHSQFSNTRRMISHGTLLVNSRLKHLRAALVPTVEVVSSKGISSQNTEVANIADYLDRAIGMIDLRRRLIAAVQGAWGCLTQLKLSAGDWDRVHALADRKYRRWSWNFGNSPGFLANLTANGGDGPFRVKIGVDNGLVSSVDCNGNVKPPKGCLELEKTLLGTRFDPGALGAL